MKSVWNDVHKGLMDTLPVEVVVLSVFAIILVALGFWLIYAKGSLGKYRYGTMTGLPIEADDLFPKRYAFLDGIRGIAIILVMVFHVWQQSWMWPTFYIGNFEIDLNHFAVVGYMGVEALFVLSGFCLFLPFAKACFTKGKFVFPVSDFYKKRLIRILPSYLFSMVILLAFDRAVNIGTGWTMVKNILSHLLFVNNFSVLNGGSYINAVYWSLAVEIQFYLLFPLIASLMKKWPHITTFAVTLLANLYRAYILFVEPTKLSALFNLLPGMIDMFVLGMYGAWWAMRLRAGTARLENKGRRIHTYVMTCGFVVLTLLLCSIMFWHKGFIYTDTGYTVVSPTQMFQTLIRPTWGIVVALQMICGVFLINWVEKIFANPFNVFIARISLNLYLWHQWIAVKLRTNNVLYYDAVRYSANQYDPNWSKNAFWLSIILSIFAAYLITYLWDEPVTSSLIKWFVRPKDKVDDETQPEHVPQLNYE